MLLIQRAVKHGDPWSGHMAFPGGRVEPSDRSPRAAARRETREEVGLVLATAARPVGRLSDVLATAHGRPLPLVISPFVYALREDRDVGFDLNEEVDEAVWVPLDYFSDPAQREQMDWQLGGVTFELPCYRYDGHLVWGLTLEMLDELFERMGWLRGVVQPRHIRRRRWLVRLVMRGLVPAVKRRLGL